MKRVSYTYKRAKARQRMLDRLVRMMEQELYIVDETSGSITVILPTKYGGGSTAGTWRHAMKIAGYSLRMKPMSSLLARLRLSFKICRHCFRYSSQASSENEAVRTASTRVT